MSRLNTQKCGDSVIESIQKSNSKTLSPNHNCQKISEIMGRFFKNEAMSESSMKYYAPNYTDRLRCDNKIDAVLAREAEVHRLLGKQSGSVTIQKLERNHSVYAFRLDIDVVGEKKFNEANPELEQLEELVYVGMTSKSREERYTQHMNAPEKRERPWAQVYA